MCGRLSAGVSKRKSLHQGSHEEARGPCRELPYLFNVEIFHGIPVHVGERVDRKTAAMQDRIRRRDNVQRDVNLRRVIWDMTLSIRPLVDKNWFQPLFKAQSSY